jgi:hypothetical protein
MVVIAMVIVLETAQLYEDMVIIAMVIVLETA